MVSRRKKAFRWWRRAGMTLRLFVFALCCLLLGLLVFSQRPSASPESTGANVLVFLLVNVNVILLIVLMFLVGRNVVRLVFDRRKNILGSRLKVKLVAAFVGLTLIPTVIIFVLASGLLTQAMSGWFSGQVEASIAGAVKVAKNHYRYLRQEISREAADLAADLERRPLALSDPKALSVYLEEYRNKEELFSITIVNRLAEPVVEVANAAAAVETFQPPPLDRRAVENALGGKSAALFEEREASQYIRIYEPIDFLQEQHVLVVSERVDPNLSLALAVVNDSYREYEQLKFFKNPLRAGYRLTLAMITALILFAALWFAFYITRIIVDPIEKLLQGTREVSRGNLGFHIRAIGDDELAVLVKSFNIMTRDLRHSRDVAERRRSYIEAVLAHLAVGVIGLDRERCITSMNAAALDILAIEGEEAPVEESLERLFPDSSREKVLRLISVAEEQGKSATGSSFSGVEMETQLVSEGKERKILLTAGPIRDSQKNWLGTVLLLDDITELNQAQRMAAWREVARRIAHEIKNPLTPIQLSAQRIEKLLREGGDKQKLQESAEVIVEHVGSIKRLANEFSEFARMPEAELTLSGLDQLLSDTVSSFAENNQDISFQFVAEGELPDIYIDREQIRRALMNLLENAAAAIREERAKSPELPRGRVLVQSFTEAGRDGVGFEVTDNGPGIALKDRGKVFEPYYSTKANGSGLGLAIVRSTITDHHGELRVVDNAPRGARFIVRLPVRPRRTTQRRLSVQ